MKSDFFFFIAAISVSQIDIVHYRIPDRYIALPLSFSIAELLSRGEGTLIARGLLMAAIFLILCLFRRLVKGAFGFGDVKFISASALSLGLVGVWIELLVGCLSAILFTIASGRGKDRIAFAPFLALGLFAAMLVDRFITAS